MKEKGSKPLQQRSPITSPSSESSSQSGNTNRVGLRSLISSLSLKVIPYWSCSSNTNHGSTGLTQHLGSHPGTSNSTVFLQAQVMIGLHLNGGCLVRITGWPALRCRKSRKSASASECRMEVSEASESSNEGVYHVVYMTTYQVQFVLPVNNPVSNVSMRRVKGTMFFEVPINHPDAHNMSLMDLIAAAELSGLLTVSPALNNKSLTKDSGISKGSGSATNRS